MEPLEGTFSVHELAGALGEGMTARTVRYYIAEGILPRPDERGRFSRTHLNRLRLIQRLKDAYLPLAEIRSRMAAVSDEEVAAALTGYDSATAEETGPPQDAMSSSAADYIRRLRCTAGVNRSAPGDVQDRMSEPPSSLTAPPALRRRARREPTPEAWDRRTLAPGVELHVRRNPAPDPAVKVLADRLLSLAEQMAVDLGLRDQDSKDQ